jgi:hypothetical protein
MPLTFNAVTDFSQVVDTLEPITLRRAGTLEEIEIPAAWRFSQIQTAAPDGSGFTLQTDCIWQFEWDEEVAPPQVNDDLIDADAHEWTLIKVERLAGITRWRCTGRELT